MNKSEMINGRVYYIDTHGKYFLRCIDRSRDGLIYGNPYIHINSLTYNHGSGAWNTTTKDERSFKEIRLAANDEVEWFEACEKAKTFLPQPKILNTYQIC